MRCADRNADSKAEHVAEPSGLGAVLAVPLAIKAEQPVKVVRIGWLGGASPGEGQNFILEFRWAHGMTEQLPHLAAEFVRRKVDFIIVASSPSALAAIHATSIIPIVMVSGGVDPVGQGLVASLARPGGNVTGLVLFPGAEVAGKYLEIFQFPDGAGSSLRYGNLKRSFRRKEH